MPSKTQTFKSFRDLAAAVQREDIRKAQNLRKSSALAKRGNNNGPRIAR